MKKIIAGVMSLIMLMSTAVLPGCYAVEYPAAPSLASRETVVLGNYHDKDLEWIVLDTNDRGEKLLLSKYVIDARFFNEIVPGASSYEDRSWGTSTLRRWLNVDFQESTFTEPEQIGIQRTYIDDSSVFARKHNETVETGSYDDLFLLSIDEANRYFASDEDRRAKPLEDPDSYEDLWVDEDGYCSWWLRSSGSEDGCSASVRSTGFIYHRGDLRNNFHLGVRPAMWVNFHYIESAIEAESSRMESELAEEAKEREEYEARDKSRIKFRSDNTATFGTYNSGSIEWIVLDRQDDKVLLITRDIIDCIAYDYSEKDVTWEKCQMRQWLNNSFYNKAFGSSEKGLILKTDVVNGYSAEYKTNGGNDTQDKVFLLSVDEAKKYFPNDGSRQAAGAKDLKNGSLYVDENGYSLWWLRTPGAVGSASAYVDHLGRIKEGGMYNKYYYVGVRPAIWVTLK